MLLLDRHRRSIQVYVYHPAGKESSLNVCFDLPVQCQQQPGVADNYPPHVPDVNIHPNQLITNLETDNSCPSEWEYFLL